MLFRISPMETVRYCFHAVSFFTHGDCIVFQHIHLCKYRIVPILVARVNNTVTMVTKLKIMVTAYANN